MSSSVLFLSPTARQICAAVGVLMNAVTQGVVLSFGSSLLAQLDDPRARPDWLHDLDFHSASLLSTILSPAILIGQTMSSVLMDVIGRRTTFLVAQVPGIAGWILIYFANSYSVLLTGRLFTGIGGGFVATLSAIVIGEYTDPKHRGVYLSLKLFFFNLGCLITHNVVGLLSWRTIALSAIVPYVVTAAILAACPESPAWLAYIENYEKCRKDFFLMRERTESSVWEVEELIAAQKEQHSLTTKNSSIFAKLKCYFKKFAQKDFLKPLIVLIFAFVLLEASGGHFFSAYAIRIISDITGPGVDHKKYVLAIDVLNTVSAFAAVPLMRVLRRRTLLLASGLASLVALTPTCILLYLISSERLSRDYQLIPICLLSLFFFLVNLGCGTICVALRGELFPVRHRGVSLAAGAFIFFILLSISLHFTLFSLFYLKVYGTFALCGVVMALTLLGLYVMLPETKDRTLQEIEDYFQNGRFGVSRVAKGEAHLQMITQEDD